MLGDSLRHFSEILLGVPPPVPWVYKPDVHSFLVILAPVLKMFTPSGSELGGGPDSGLATGLPF